MRLSFQRLICLFNKQISGKIKLSCHCPLPELHLILEEQNSEWSFIEEGMSMSSPSVRHWELLKSSSQVETVGK